MSAVKNFPKIGVFLRREVWCHNFLRFDEEYFRGTILVELCDNKTQEIYFSSSTFDRKLEAWVPIEKYMEPKVYEKGYILCLVSCIGEAFDSGELLLDRNYCSRLVLHL